jgi:hypothetical protein
MYDQNADSSGSGWQKSYRLRENGSKRPMLVDGAGVPLVPVATGADRHDVSRFETLSDAFVVTRPDIFEQPQHLCLDKDYSGEPALETVVL